MSCAVGAFVNGIENLSFFQSQVNKKLAVVLWYIHWSDPFPAKEAEIVAKNNSIPMLTWEPWLAKGLDPIINEEQEAYIEQFIQAAKAYGKPILLRFAHEMNGNWYPWDGVHNSSEKYKKAWLYIYNVKQKLKANNILLVWCPNNRSLPNKPWNQIKNYYPGDQYVDWVGMDGYNWGYGNNETFDQVFSDIYRELIKLCDKPIMIGEFATAGNDQAKTAWFKDALEQLKTKYSKVKLICWFNINKERDWRVAPDFTSLFSDSHFSDKMV